MPDAIVITSKSLPVDASGNITIEYMYMLDVELPKYVRVKKLRAGNPGPWMESLVLNGVRKELERLFDPKSLTRMGSFMASWVYLGMKDRLAGDGLQTSKLIRQMEYKWIGWHSYMKTKNMIRTELHASISMPFYGAYVDGGRGPARSRGYQFDEGRTEFLALLEAWVQDNLNSQYPDYKYIAKSIWNSINETGRMKTKPNHFFTDTMVELVDRDIVDKLYETEFERMFTVALERGVTQALEDAKGYPKVRVTT